MDANRLLAEGLPDELPDRIATRAEELAGVPTGLYVVDIAGTALRRLAGADELPAEIALRGGIGPELPAEALAPLEAGLAQALPGGVVIPLWLRGRALAVLVCAAPPRETLEELAREAAPALELSTGYADRVDRARRHRPTSAAAEVQQTMLAPRIARVRGASLAGSLLPAYDVGGDWFDHAEDPGGVWLAVGDAVGKGSRAAAISALALGALRAERLAGCPLEVACRSVHDVLRTLDEDAFLTAVLARWVPAERTFAWVLCGHPRPLLVTAGGEVEELEGEATYPLGVFEDDARAFPRNERRLGPGERVVLYSDGISEARRADGSFFGADGIAAAVASVAATSAAATVHVIESALLSETGGELADDATTLVLAVD